MAMTITEADLRDLLRSVPGDPRAAAHLIVETYTVTRDGELTSPWELTGYLRAGGDLDEKARMLLRGYSIKPKIGYFVAEDAAGDIVLWRGQPDADDMVALISRRELDRADRVLWPAVLAGLGVQDRSPEADR